MLMFSFIRPAACPERLACTEAWLSRPYMGQRVEERKFRVWLSTQAVEPDTPRLSLLLL